MKTSGKRHLPPMNLAILTPLYDFFCELLGLGKKFKQKVLTSVEIQDGMTIADIGCGTGVLLKIAQEKYPKVTFIGIDPDAKALTIAQERLNKAHLYNIKLHKTSAESLPFHPSSIDVAFSTLAFHHMPDDIKRKAMQEMYRVLKPGGVAVIADFGESRNIFFRKILFFEKLEYLEGNLNGLIPRYLKEVGFHKVKIVGKHFPGIAIVKAKKN